MSQTQPDRNYRANKSPLKPEVHRGSRLLNKQSREILERELSGQRRVRQMLRINILTNPVNLRSQDHSEVLLDKGEVKTKSTTVI